MAGERLKISFKYAAFIIVIGVVAQLLAAFLVGLFGGLVLENPSEDTLTSVSTIVGMLVLLPFAYYFSYKAVVEYLSGGPNRWQKNIGISVALGTIFFSTAIPTGISYFLTGQFNFSFGLLPILLSLVAGRKAEAKFARK